MQWKSKAALLVEISRIHLEFSYLEKVVMEKVGILAISYGAREATMADAFVRSRE